MPTKLTDAEKALIRDPSFNRMSSVELARRLEVPVQQVRKYRKEYGYTGRHTVRWRNADGSYTCG